MFHTFHTIIIVYFMLLAQIVKWNIQCDVVRAECQMAHTMLFFKRSMLQLVYRYICY